MEETSCQSSRRLRFLFEHTADLHISPVGIHSKPEVEKNYKYGKCKKRRISLTKTSCLTAIKLDNLKSKSKNIKTEIMIDQCRTFCDLKTSIYLFKSRMTLALLIRLLEYPLLDCS